MLDSLFYEWLYRRASMPSRVGVRDKHRSACLTSHGCQPARSNRLPPLWFSCGTSILGLSGVRAAAPVYRMTVLSFRRRATCSDDAGSPEQLELLGRIAQLRADLLGVFAEHRRAHDFHRGVRQP